MGEIVERKELSKQLMNGVGGVGAGTAILILQGLIGGWFGYVAAGVLILAGLAMSASKSQKKAGAVALGAGVIIGLIPLLSNILPILGSLIWVAGFGLILAGGYSLFKFAKNMKNRM